MTSTAQPARSKGFLAYPTGEEASALASSALAAARSFLASLRGEQLGRLTGSSSREASGTGEQAAPSRAASEAGDSSMGCVHPRFPHTTDAEGLEVTEHWRRRSLPEDGPDDETARRRQLRGGSVPSAAGDGGHLSNWAAHERRLMEEAANGQGGGGEGTDELENVPVEVAPTPLPEGTYTPEMSEDSGLLRPEHARALAAAVPLRHRWRYWHLLYSTARDGTSLATLYRRSPPATPAVLVVREQQGAVFGCFTPEPWRVAKRYYGTGECFVFRLKPEAVLWRWHERRMAQQRNDFFQFSTAERLALGGGPQYALSLDTDLAWGSSGLSETFGSPCLASADHFAVGRVELWGLF